MIKNYFFLILLFPTTVFSQNQVFNGKLTYIRIPSDTLLNSDTIHLNSGMFSFKTQTTYREILIKDSMLLEKRSLKNGTLLGMVGQIGFDVHILDLANLKRKIYHQLLSG